MNNKTISYQLSNGKELAFTTHPDLFAPNNIDIGTLAMLKSIAIKKTDKVLDLGCGYGFVGIYLAAEYGIKDITMSDIDPLAVEYVKKNAAINHIDNLTIIQSNGLAEVVDKDYTLILSNPPYHTDFSVAKGFIEQGFRQLSLNGRLVMVVKRLLWYKNKITSVFGGVRIQEIDGYYILTAEKRSIKSPAKPNKKTKSKHQKRLQKTKQKRKK